MEAVFERGLKDPEMRLREVLFVSLFFGVGGTRDQVAAALYIIRKDKHLLSSFWKDPRAFVVEAARLYPGVGGMDIVLRSNASTTTLGNGRVVQTRAGDRVVVWTAAGNRDPNVFGGP